MSTKTTDIPLGGIGYPAWYVRQLLVGDDTEFEPYHLDGETLARAASLMEAVQTVAREEAPRP